MTDDQMYDVYLKFYAKVRGRMPLTDYDFVDATRGNEPLTGRGAAAAVVAVEDATYDSNGSRTKADVVTKVNTMTGTAK